MGKIKNAIYKGKKVKVWLTPEGLVKRMEYIEEPGVWYLPLIENGENVEKFEILEHTQISLF